MHRSFGERTWTAHKPFPCRTAKRALELLNFFRPHPPGWFCKIPNSLSVGRSRLPSWLIKSLSLRARALDRFYHAKLLKESESSEERKRWKKSQRENGWVEGKTEKVSKGKISLQTPWSQAQQPSKSLPHFSHEIGASGKFSCGRSRTSKPCSHDCWCSLLTGH